MQVWKNLRTVLEMIKFEHTIFALPFAFLGMVLAAGGWPRGQVVAWITVAMVGGRSAAMGFNRLVDRDVDATNPRTADRALPSGQVSPRFVGLFVLGSSLLLIGAAWRLNPLALALSPLLLLILFGYSYTKRFTTWSHLFLGLAISGAPLGAWIAVRGDLSATPLVLSAAVLFWVAGFDVLYSLQDREFDLRSGLHSIPARYGTTGALWISGLLHLAMLGCLILLPRVYGGELGTGYWIGVTGCLVLLGYQHWVIRPADLSRLDAAFFRANGLLAIWIFTTTTLDLLW